MSAMTLDDVLADIQLLPSLPAVVVELIATLDNEAADIAQLATGIAKDQALAARALRVANSPFYGVQQRVSSIHDAIVILGFRAVGSLVTAAALTDYFAPPPESGFDLARFWRHSIAAALCARSLAQHVGLNAEASFTAGLLHDIGVLVLLTTRPWRYAEVLLRRQQDDRELHHLEREILGFDHARVGEALAARWRFPPEIASAVASHHAPLPRRADAGRVTLEDTVHVGNVLAHALDLSGDPDDLVPALDASAWARLALGASTLKVMFSAIEQEHAGYRALLTH